MKHVYLLAAAALAASLTATSPGWAQGKGGGNDGGNGPSANASANANGGNSANAPGQNDTGVRPGNGFGDTNHTHSGPPGLANNENANGQATLNLGRLQATIGSSDTLASSLDFATISSVQAVSISTVNGNVSGAVQRFSSDISTLQAELTAAAAANPTFAAQLTAAGVTDISTVVAISMTSSGQLVIFTT